MLRKATAVGDEEDENGEDEYETMIEKDLDNWI